MTRKSAAANSSWASWVRKVLGLRKSSAQPAASAKAESGSPEQKRKPQEPQFRPRFTEGLEDRRMLSVATAISFEPAQFYPDRSGTLAIGTFINGGLPDIVGASAANDSVHVLLNNGDGTFRSGQTFYVLGAKAEAVGDFNHDGNQDIAVISPQSNITGAPSTIYIFYGNGDGTFQTPPKQYPINYQASDIVAADVNGDGNDDLLITGSHRVVVFMNEGNGKFAPGVAYPAGDQYAGKLVLGDFNGDGVTDVAVTRTLSNEISILFGQKGADGLPNGTFSKPEVYRLSTNPKGIAIGDFTGNGISDLAVANSDFRQPGMSVLLGNGDGSFGQAQAYYGGNFVDGIAVGDFAGDGIEDIATVSFTSFLRVYAGNGDGTFQPFKEFSGSSYGQEVATADFNGDGKDDIAVATGGGIRVLISTSTAVQESSTNGILVTIGAGSRRSITYQDVSGYRTTVALSGPGSANIAFTGSDLSLNANGDEIVGGPASIGAIAATGTTAHTTLAITAATRNGRISIGAITTQGSFKAISAPQVNLSGNLAVEGTIANLSLNNASNGTITLVGSGLRANLRISNATNENLSSSQPIGTMTVGQWYSLTSTPNQIAAPGIGQISAESQFEANLTVGSGGISSVNVRNIPQGTWTVAGPVGSISATRDIQLNMTAPSLKSIYAGNNLNNDVIATTGNIGSITAGSMINSSFYAGVGTLPAGQRLPDSASQFTGPARIGSVLVRTRTKVKTDSFINSSLAAPAIGSVDLGIVAFDNAGQVQGIAAESVGSLSGSDAITGKVFNLIKPLTLQPLVNQRIDTADFVLNIL